MSGDLHNQFFPMGADIRVIRMQVAVAEAELMPVLVDTGLEFQSEADLIALDDAMWFDFTEEGGSHLAGHSPRELDAVCGVSQIVTVFVDGACICGTQLLDNGAVCHTDASKHLISDMEGTRFVPLGYPDPTLSVKKTGRVNVVHLSSQGSVGMVANSVDTRCPAERCGRAIPSQAGARLALGVCNEHVLPGEPKMCSALHGNMQKSAEMTGSDDVCTTQNIHHQVTDGNTDYLFLRPHRDRNMVPLNPDRFSVNQDAMVRLIAWAGNMTMSNRFQQGLIKA